MANKNSKPRKEPFGRPTSYKPEYAQQAFKLCLLGATDAKLADFFGVAEQTINAWKKDNPDFLESLKDGKKQADAQVANSLYQRAIGYSHAEDKIFNHNGVPLVVPTIKRYPPDTTAAIFWLKNRDKQNWRDKVDHEHTGKDGGPIQTQVIRFGEYDITI